jgi:hypothetical protein
LKSEQQPELQLANGPKADYVYAYTNLQGISRPTFLQQYIVENTNEGLLPGTYNYVAAVKFNNGIIGLSSLPNVVTVLLPHINTSYQRWRVEFQMPYVPASYGVTSRQLYRASYYSNIYRFVGEASGSFGGTVTDQLAPEVWQQQAELNDVKTFSAWFRYDFENNFWDRILDTQNGINRPVGRIFNAQVQLRFTRALEGSPFEEYDFNPQYVAAFFNFDMTEEQFRNQFRDFFVPTQEVKCAVKSLDFNVSDGVRTERLGNVFLRTDAYIVKSARLDMIKKESELVLESRI